MERILRTQEYLGSILQNNLKGINKAQSSSNGIGLTLAQITGNYCHSDFESALIGFGLHFDGYIHVSIDEDIICHNPACIGWMERITKLFNIPSSHINVIRTARPKSLYNQETGFAIGHEKLVSNKSFGTLGGFIYPKAYGDSYRIFSNNHVLANTNVGVQGDAICAVTNSPYRIGVLEKFVTLYGDGTPNYLDLAVAKLEGFQPTYTPVIANSKYVIKNEAVTKFGAKTGYTVGKVVSNSYKTIINYNGENALFKDQLMIVSSTSGQRFSDGGDSGSMIKSSTGDFLGLLFAGNKFQTFANPSHLVINKLTEWGYL